MLKSVTALTAILFASSVYAETYSVTATVKNIQIVQETITQNVPVTNCVNTYQPGATGGDVLSGMIIGGLIGKGATGNNSGATVGAVIGGMVAAENGRSVQRCTNGYRQENVPVGTHYVVTYDWNGLMGEVETNQRYFIGDSINVQITLH